MTSFAAAVKAEITRISRKEVRAQIEPFRKASIQYRRDIGALKKRLASVERAAKVPRSGAPKIDTSSESGKAKRFSVKGLRSHRTRLGLSVDEVGKILGVSGQTVRNWEQQKTVPRPAQVEGIAVLRGLGKRGARERLAGQGEQRATSRSPAPT